MLESACILNIKGYQVKEDDIRKIESQLSRISRLRSKSGSVKNLPVSCAREKSSQ
jgi:hypothetical protein